jgi:NADH:ubiquinone oxidoreductase subunit E
MMNTGKFIDEIINLYNQERKNLLPILQEVVKSEHYLSEVSLKEIALKMDLKFWLETDIKNLFFIT